MLEIARPPRRIAGWVHTLAGILAPAGTATAKRPDRRGYASIFDGEQAWAGGAVRCPVKLRRLYVEACYARKLTADQALQCARFEVARHAYITRQPMPPYGTEALKAGPGSAFAPPPGSRTAHDAAIARAAKATAAERAKRIADRQARQDAYKRAADEALGAGT